jgi:hypothetical protein
MTAPFRVAVVAAGATECCFRPSPTNPLAASRFTSSFSRQAPDPPPLGGIRPPRAVARRPPCAGCRRAPPPLGGSPPRAAARRSPWRDPLPCAAASGQDPLQLQAGNHQTRRDPPRLLARSCSIQRDLPPPRRDPPRSSTSPPTGLSPPSDSFSLALWFLTVAGRRDGKR